jgi:CheY-like chemotaxis protein
MEANDPRERSVQRILLAEDDEDMRRFLVKALAKAGYDVVSFGNGLEAYERLKEEPFTLLFTDIVMPEMDGIELARKASKRARSRSQDHVHHRLRRRGAQSRQYSEGREDPVEAVPPARSGRPGRASTRCVRSGGLL